MRFGGLRALECVSIDVPQGRIFSLIGPNGAGKTTLFNCITRMCIPQSGRILFQDIDLLTLKAHQICTLGITRTFQNVELCSHLSVRQNLTIGLYSRFEYGLVGSLFPTRARRSEEKRHQKRVMEVVDFLGLDPCKEYRVSGLPFGLQKVVELGRALATNPKLVLLDEPASGMNREERDRLTQHPPPDQGRPGDDGSSGGTRHELRHEHQRSDFRPQFRGEDRRRDTRGGQEEPIRHRSLSRERSLRDARRLEHRDPLRKYPGPQRGSRSEVPKGDIVSVLGANGSGKSTLLRTIMGLIAPSRGAIRFEEKSIAGMKPHKVVRLGISLVPENRELFPDLTVHENLLMGAFTRRGKAKPDDIEEIFRYFPVLRGAPAGSRRGRSPEASSRCSPSAGP